MARRCRSCDGILEVDCFNESECEYIGHMQEAQKENDIQMQIHYLKEEADHLKTQKAELLEALERSQRLIIELEEVVDWDLSEIIEDNRQAIAKARGDV